MSGFKSVIVRAWGTGPRTHLWVCGPVGVLLQPLPDGLVCEDVEGAELHLLRLRRSRGRDAVRMK